jgi:outer membrane protein OmpA-like peptidoglycan-associated protein/tetratricopeptide (TPR) repeat protein
MLNTIVKRILLLLIASTLLSQAHSQTDKRLILADQYFAEGEYFTAAGLYEQFLNPAVKEKPKSDFPLNSKKNAQGRIGTYVNRTDIQYKQAESYRLANYWMKASGLYKECFEKDAAKYSAALYWYAVCQRSTGNYAASEESINRFLNENGASNPYRQEAEREKKILQFIQSQLTRPDSILYHVKKIETSFGNEKGVFAPAAGLGNQFMITSTQTDSVVAPGINPNHNRLFYSALTNGTLQNIQPVIIEGADTLLNQGAASISANGNYLYFTQWTKENGQVLSSIYYAIKNENGWGKPIFLNSVNQKGYSSKQPFCSGDGKYLFFASDRTGGKGNFDIWYAPLQADGTTDAPVNAGVVLNTAENELAPFYHSSSNTLIFSSDRMPGMGGYDLFMSNGTETIWKTPENMGYPVNSSRDDVYFFAAEKGTVFNNAFFSSDRGSECCLATYTVSKSPKKRMIAGVIRDCRDNEPVADAEVIMKDALGKTVRTTTGIDGKYTFELAGNNQQHQFFVSKEKYSEKTADMIVEGKNETHWLTDTLYNGTLCIDKKLVIKVENVVTVYFDFDKSQLKERGVAQLDSIYNVLAENVTATIQISGYTDGLGTAEYNKVLSDKRAKTCADYLIGKGIDTNRISFESFGACCPIEMELINGRDNPDGRSMNRRALINIDKD